MNKVLFVFFMLFSFEVSAFSHCPKDVKNLPKDGDNCYTDEFYGMKFYTCWKNGEKDGKRDGIECSYQENGMLFTEEHWKNGELDGVRRKYFDNGLLWREDNYVNGRSIGDVIAFYETGELQFRGYYEDYSMKSGTCYTKDGIAIPITKKQLTYNNCKYVFRDNGLEWHR